MAGTRALLGCIVALAWLLAFASPAAAKPGDLDRSFGDDGVAKTAFPPGYAYGYAVAIGKQGRIVAAGNSDDDVAIARYLPTGELDPAFAGDGTVTTSLGDRKSYAYDVAIGRKGSIVAAGATCHRMIRCQFAVARYKSDGQLDPSFGQGGKATVAFGNKTHVGATAVAIDSRGRVVLTGDACAGDLDDCNFALARLKKDGSLDRSFGKQGRVTTRFKTKSGRHTSAQATSMEIDSHRRIVVGGEAGRNQRGLLARYEPSGHLDSRFGRRGRVSKKLRHLTGIRAIAVDAKDKVVAAGFDSASSGRWALARFGRHGGLDSSFGKRGEVSTAIRSREPADPQAVAIDSRNRIVVAGGHEFSLARYQPIGHINRSFGHRGRAYEDFGNGEALGLAIDSRNRPVAAGYNRGEFAVARFLG